MRNLTNQELYKITEDLYKHANPNTRMGEPPSSVYVTVMEKWYPEYQRSTEDIDFFSWCLKYKS